MQHSIRGEIGRVLDLQLAEGERLYSVHKLPSWMSQNMDIEINSRQTFMKGIGSMLEGKQIDYHNFSCKGSGTMTFHAVSPGKILPMQLVAGQSIVVHVDAFLIAEDSVTPEVVFNDKISKHYMSGHPYILLKLSGPGTVFIEIAGEMTQYGLAEGQGLRVLPGSIAFFDASVTYQMTKLKAHNLFFTDDKLHFVDLAGPGKIFLQGFDFPQHAYKMHYFIPPKGKR
jgi:uncharacterized protein (AIM24 family)